jgi:N-acetylneuraminate synthase
MTNRGRQSVYIIAEAGVNHNGDPLLARELVDVAAEAGADAVKFQSFKAEKLVKRSAPKATYQLQNTHSDETQLDMLRKLELSDDIFADLEAYAISRGIEFLSSPFCAESLHMLVSLGMKKVKVPSGELTNGPLIWEIARTGLPIILSTGMATSEEIEQAMAVILHGRQYETEPTSMDEIMSAWRRQGANGRALEDVTLLHCTSEYPAPLHEINLLAMQGLAAQFGTAVGYSDHTEGIVVPIAAAALGASIIEKHFTLDKSMYGPDHRASLSPDEFHQMVTAVRAVELSLGDSVKRVQSGEESTRQAARQQVIAARAVLHGQTIKRDDLTTARCGVGLPPNQLWQIVGKTASRDYLPGDLINESAQ